MVPDGDVPLGCAKYASTSAFTMGPAIVAPKSGVGWYGTTTAIAIVGSVAGAKAISQSSVFFFLLPGLGGTGLRGDVVLRGEPDPRRRAVGRGHDRLPSAGR